MTTSTEKYIKILEERVDELSTLLASKETEDVKKIININGFEVLKRYLAIRSDRMFKAPGNLGSTLQQSNNRIISHAKAVKLIIDNYHDYDMFKVTKEIQDYINIHFSFLNE